MGVGHGSRRGCTGHDERLRSGTREFHRVDRDRTGILLRKLRVDRGLKGDLRHRALQRDTHLRRGVHRTDGLGRRARHHEAARAQRFGRDIRKGAVIVSGRLLHEGRECRPGFGRRSVVVRNGIERAFGSGSRLREREGRRFRGEFRDREIAAQDQISRGVERKDRERREALLPRLGRGRGIEEGAGLRIIARREGDRYRSTIRACLRSGVNHLGFLVARSKQRSGESRHRKNSVFHGCKI